MSENNNNESFWVSVVKLALRIPVPSILFVLAYFLYRSNDDGPASIVLFAGLLLSVVLVIDELYRGSIKNLKSDVTYYSKMAQQAHTKSFKHASDSTEQVLGIAAKYAKAGDSTTSTE